MTEIFNIKNMKERRRKFRNNPTEVEHKLWQYLKRKQIGNIQFHRQYGIGGYIADFYAPNVKLCIEVDGAAHFSKDGKEYDRVRDEYMNSIGIKVLRFSNYEVLSNIENVVRKIKHVLES